MNISFIQKHKNLKALFEFISFFFGVVIFSAGIGLFITPGKIAIGGFTGISIIINNLCLVIHIIDEFLTKTVIAVVIADLIKRNLSNLT